MATASWPLSLPLSLFPLHYNTFHCDCCYAPTIYGESAGEEKSVNCAASNKLYCSHFQPCLLLFSPSQVKLHKLWLLVWIVACFCPVLIPSNPFLLCIPRLPLTGPDPAQTEVNRSWLRSAQSEPCLVTPLIATTSLCC